MNIQHDVEAGELNWNDLVPIATLDVGDVNAILLALKRNLTPQAVLAIDKLEQEIRFQKGLKQDEIA